MGTILPTEKFCPELGKACLGDRCAYFSFVNYGGYGHSRMEGGCWRYHLPKVIRKIDW